MKIGREDFESLMKGEKTIAPYIEIESSAPVRIQFLG